MPAHVQRLLEHQTRNANLTDSGLSSVYAVVLNHLWSARYSAAADIASSAVIEEPDHVTAPKLYRAWIEALAQMGDNESLAELATHLLNRGQEEPELRQTWMALRGVIHVELDQAPAVRLLSRAIHGRVHNAYCLEFEQLCVRRGMTDGECPIATTSANIDDYLVWNTLLQDLATGHQRDALNECLKHVQKVFPGSPAFELYNLHLSLEHGQWPAATRHAAKLRSQFPDHPDHAFYEAYAAFRGNDVDHAITTLEAIESTRKRSDVDVLTLTGECYAAKAKRDDDDTFAKKAIETLAFAAKLRRRNGLAVDQTLDVIREMEDRVGGSIASDYSQNHFREPRNWLVMLSPRRAAELVATSDEVATLLHRPLGAEAAPGDVVLFVTRGSHVTTKATSVRNELRLISMYRVTSRPYWHPVHRWHSSLELIDRPEHPIPVDAQEVKSDIDVRGKRTSLPRGHHARFGVYSLDDSAMEIMISAVKRRSDGIDHGRERRGEKNSQSKQKPG